MYYGGWGRCNVVRLNANFTGLLPFPDGTFYKEVTPPGYVEVCEINASVIFFYVKRVFFSGTFYVETKWNILLHVEVIFHKLNGLKIDDK